MAEMSLKDVIERLKSEGDLVRNSGTNSMKSIKEVLNVISETMIDQTSVLKELLEINKKTFEMQERKDKLGIAEKTVIGGDPITDTEPEKVKKQTEESLNIFQELVKRLGPLGLAVGAAALGIGTAIGVVKGQIDAIRLFFPTITRFITTTFNDFIQGIGKTFSSAADRIKTRIGAVSSNIIKVFDDLLDWVRNTFSGTNQSRLGRAVASFSGYIKSLIKPFIDIGKMIGDLLKGPIDSIRTSFSNISQYLRNFRNAITSIANIARRIFLPLTIIMTAFETITEAIDGFKEDGVMGALKGAINGFVTSLITGPLDFLKDMVAWIADKLGFDKTASFLREFSFTDLWRKLTDVIFNFLDKLIDTVVDYLPPWAKKILGISASEEVDDVTRVQNELSDLETERKQIIQQAEFDTMSSGVLVTPNTSSVDARIAEKNAELIQINSTVPDNATQNASIPNQQSATSTSRQSQLFIGGEPFVEGVPLSQNQIAAVGMAIQMGNVPQPAVLTAYNEQIGSALPQVLSDAVNPLAAPSMLKDVSIPISENINEIEQYLANTQSPSQAASVSNLNTVSQLATQQQMAPQVTVNAPVVAPVNNTTGGSSVNNYATTNISGGSSSGMGRFAN